MRSRERERDESACNNQHSLDPVNAIVERGREREVGGVAISLNVFTAGLRRSERRCPMAVGGLMLIPVTAAVGSFQLGLRSVGGERGDDSEWNQFIAY